MTRPEQPLTRVSLLLRLRDPDDAEAWREFVEIYAGLVYRYGRRRGLQDADAADLTQDVLQAVSRTIATLEYDPARGSFRGWLRTVAHRRWCDLVGRRQREPVGAGDTALTAALEQTPAPDEGDAWEEDYRQTIFQWLVKRIRPCVSETTWQAFWRTAVEGQEGRIVAEGLGLTVAAVYLARARVMARLREEARLYEE